MGAVSPTSSAKTALNANEEERISKQEDGRKGKI